MTLVRGVPPLPGQPRSRLMAEPPFPVSGRAEHLSIARDPSSQPATQLLR